jgi:hypothetical protein
MSSSRTTGGNFYTLYLGEHVRGHEVPWHYPFVMLGVMVPAVILGLFLLAAVLGFLRAVRRDPDFRPLGLLILWAFFTPVA